MQNQFELETVSVRLYKYLCEEVIGSENLPGSDFDTMLLWKLWEVYEDMPKDKVDVLLLDTDHALPGFALLNKSDSSSFPNSATVTADGNLI